MAGVGRRFRPQEEFLIKVLRWKTKRGDNFDLSRTTEVPGDLPEICMYGPGTEPWKLFSGAHEITELSESNDTKQIIREKYVVTKLQRIGKKNCSRVAGAGNWVDKSKKRPVYLRGQKVGHWSTLIYEYAGDDGAEEGKFYYTMNELHLSQPTDYVVCRVMKNLSKGCLVKDSTKRRREEGDVHCPAAAKRSRREEIPESSFCSEVVVPGDDEKNQEYFSEIFDFSDPVELQEQNIPVYDPNLFSCDASELITNICAQQQEVDSFCEGDGGQYYSGPGYVPDMSGIEQNQEQAFAEQLWDNPQMMQGSCSYSTMADLEKQVLADDQFWDNPQMMQGSCSYSTMADLEKQVLADDQLWDNPQMMQGSCSYSTMAEQWSVEAILKELY